MQVDTVDRQTSSPCSQSLLTALNKFVQAVDAMDERVMIPSRLKDMEVAAGERPQIQEQNNNMALLPTMQSGTDLFGFYRLLNTIKTEIVTGTNSEEEENDTGVQEGEMQSDDNDTSKKTAKLFKHHLGGLFNVLHQMTETAKYLTTKYETEIGDPGRPFSSFAV